MTRREQILFLLDHWNDFFDPDGTMASNGASASGIALLPLMSRHPTVLELQTCIQALGRYNPNHRKHLMLHFRSEWRTAYEPRPVLNHHGKQMRDRQGQPVTEPWPVRRRVLPLRRDELPAHLRMVTLSVDFVCATFRGEVFIPEELRDATAWWDRKQVQEFLDAAA